VKFKEIDILPDYLPRLTSLIVRYVIKIIVSCAYLVDDDEKRLVVCGDAADLERLRVLRVEHGVQMQVLVVVHGVLAALGANQRRRAVRRRGAGVGAGAGAGAGEGAGDGLGGDAGVARSGGCGRGAGAGGKRAAAGRDSCGGVASVGASGVGGAALGEEGFECRDAERGGGAHGEEGKLRGTTGGGGVAAG